MAGSRGRGSPSATTADILLVTPYRVSGAGGESIATFNIWTIGCQMNTSDARKLSEELEGQGFRETEKARSADLVVLYSCMVRQHAEDKVRSKLGELRLLKRDRPSTRIAVAGCVGDVKA